MTPEIIFEDSEILIINKPSGMASQPEKSGNKCITDYFEFPLYVVHRLDKPISGLMILAKTTETATALQVAFQSENFIKKYKAVVQNKPESDEAALENYLLTDKKLQKSFVTVPSNPLAKKSTLHYKLLKSSNRYHLLDITLGTGRFHQIRCQLAHIKSPIVGDLKYGYARSSVDGSIFLQSYHLTILHPASKKLMTFEMAAPAIWEKFGV
jgi:23S rRNA pseudouridine1911/1915/1917 synthase